MNKVIHAFANKQPLADFVDKLTATWQLLMQPNTPSKLEEGESAESILSDLVAIPSTTGNKEAIREALDYIEDFLKRRGMHIARHEWNGVESLVATTRKTKTPAVFLAGHIDVVPGPAELFRLRIADGRYYGRGVLDMKCSVAAYLSVIQQLPGDISEYDFGVMIMSDEEVGGFDGAQRLAEHGYISKMMILPDGGGNWNMERFAKGIWWLTIEANGRSAHGSRPWEGENATDKLMAILQDVRGLFPSDMNSETNTVNIGIIQGGRAFNQIPAHASASIDIRFMNRDEYLRIKDGMDAIMKKYDAKYTVDVYTDTMDNDPDNTYLKAYTECTEAVIGRPVEWITSNAGSDARFFAAKGTACAIAYPAGGNHHGPEEYIEQDAFEHLQAIFASYLETVARDHDRTARADTPQTA